jgi:hypothetical protein
VLRYASVPHWQNTLRESRPRPSRLDPYKPYLERRLAEGCTSVIQLHRELLAENAPVTYQMVRAHIASLRASPPQAPPLPPTVRQVTGWLTRHPTALSEENRAGLKDVLTRCPELDTAAGHVREFAEILTDRRGTMLLTVRRNSRRVAPGSCFAARHSARCGWHRSTVFVRVARQPLTRQNQP